MKNFKKFIVILTLVVMATSILALTTGCDETKEEPWDGRTYTVTVYLADGTTPVEGMRLALCYNIDELHSTCLNPVRTDANGSATMTIPAESEITGNPVIHIYSDKDIPAGYAYPTNFSQVVMNDNASYEHALALTAKETKIVLATAE